MFPFSVLLYKSQCLTLYVNILYWTPRDLSVTPIHNTQHTADFCFYILKNGYMFVKNSKHIKLFLFWQRVRWWFDFWYLSKELKNQFYHMNSLQDYLHQKWCWIKVVLKLLSSNLFSTLFVTEKPQHQGSAKWSIQTPGIDLTLLVVDLVKGVRCKIFVKLV